MAFDLNESAIAKTRILDLDVISQGLQIPRGNLEEEYVRDQITQDLIYRLNMYLYGEHQHKTIKYEYKVHSTIWDRIKDEWFPEWLKKRVTINFDTQVKEFDCRFNVLYPEYEAIGRKKFIAITEYVGPKVDARSY